MKNVLIVISFLAIGFFTFSQGEEVGPIMVNPHILKDRIFEYVLNLGGYVDHKNFSEGGKEVFETHFNGTLNLVKSINKNTLKCFIQIGSSLEYGNQKSQQRAYALHS